MSEDILFHLCVGAFSFLATFTIGGLILWIVISRHFKNEDNKR